MKQLRPFELVIEIARQGSISKAADAVQLSQPTLSKYLQRLEGELGVELFDRTTLPLRLTEAGERYVSAGNRMLDAANRLQKELQELKVDGERTVTLGISPSRAPYLLPRLLRIYRQSGADGRVVVRERNTAQLNADLARGELDLMISLLSDGTRGFAREVLFTESTLLAVPQYMAQLDALTVLRTQPMISIGHGLRLWRLQRRVVEDVGGQEAQLECQSIESALALVREGMGAMLVPSYIAQYGAEQHRSVAFLPLPPDCYERHGDELRRSVCVFYRKEQLLTAAERAMLDACRQLSVR